MKKLQLFLTACLLLAATTASAQFANSGASRSNGGSFNSILLGDGENDNYSRINFGYTHVSFKGNGEDLKEIGMDGFHLGYTYGLNLTQKLPLFLEMGINTQFGFGKQPFYKVEYNENSFDIFDVAPMEEEDFSLISLNIPINVTYRFSFLNGDLGVSPIMGFNFRINLHGSMDYPATSDEAAGTINCFDEDDMGDSAWKRFQMGFNVGVNFDYKHWNLGVIYTADFMPLVDYSLLGQDIETKMGTTFLTLGYKF